MKNFTMFTDEDLAKELAKRERIKLKAAAEEQYRQAADANSPKAQAYKEIGQIMDVIRTHIEAAKQIASKAAVDVEIDLGEFSVRYNSQADSWQSSDNC